MTVTGPVAADDLGVTLPHEHVFLDLTREYRGNGLLNDPALAESELRRYVDAGGRTLVDVTTGGLNGDPVGLRAMSEATGLQIVRGAGFYRRAYFPPELDELSTDARRRPDRARHRGGHRRRPGRHHRRDRLRPVHHGARGAVVPGGGPRPPAYRPDDHHPRRPLAGRHRPARPARRGGRRPGPRGDRALRHGARPRLPPGPRASAARGSSSTPCRASTSGTPSSGWAGCAAWPTPATSTGCCSARTSACAATTPRWAGRATPTSSRRSPTGCEEAGFDDADITHADGRQPAPDAHGRVAGRPYFSSAASSRSVRQRVGGAPAGRSSSARPGSR